AAVFFGREAAIVRGLDALRGIRERGVEGLFIVLGASGSGKSSFLRAGLWPRLLRDNRSFLPLPIIRPERAVISGTMGLLASLEAAFRENKAARSRAAINQVLLEPGGFNRLLAELQTLYSHIEPDMSPRHWFRFVLLSLCSTFMPLFASRRAHGARSHGRESLKPLPGLAVSYKAPAQNYARSSRHPIFPGGVLCCWPTYWFASDRSHTGV